MPVTLPAAVYAVDDDSLVLSFLEHVLTEASISVETYGCAEDFLKSYSPANPGCILIDLLMPGMNGLELQEALSIQGNFTPIIFLSGAGNVSFAVEALKSGALDFLQKPIAAAELIHTVEKAFSQDLQNRYEQLQHSHTELKIDRLTPREYEVMKWMLEGNSNKMIARILDISSRTVEVHRKNILAKMEANSLVDLAKMVSEVQK
jgi:FixJ family two-component response regulator